MGLRELELELELELSSYFLTITQIFAEEHAVGGVRAVELAGAMQESPKKRERDCTSCNSPTRSMAFFSTIAVTALVGPAPLPCQHAVRAPAVVMLENPLAKFFGGEEKKPKGGALSTGIDALLKDAPLPVKAMGALLKPLAQGLETMIEEGAADQDMLLAEAQSSLRADPRAASLIGEGASIDGVFSSSSSSSSINGVTKKMVMLQAQASGSFGSGVVAIRGEADGGEVFVTSLQLQAGGQVVDVPTLRGGGGGGGFGGGAPRGGGASVGNDGVIDIDVV